MSKILATAFVAAALAAALAYADDPQHKSGAGATQASAALSEGEVRRVDKDAKKITIRHGALANLDMPAMTMAYPVGDPAMLDQLKAGDRIRFQVEKVGSALTVTTIEPAR